MSAPGPGEITADTQTARVFEWRRGFNAMHLIDLGVQLGLFAAFAKAPGAAPAEVAAALGLHLPYVDTWCTTAYSFGMLEGGEDRKFRLAPFMDQILANPGHPRYLGGYVRLGTEFAAEDFRFCREAFRSGATVPFQGRSDAFAETVAQATAGLQVLSARKILPELPGLKAKLDSGGAILEIGCGTGRHLLQLAKAFPAARCFGFEIDPTGLEAARAAIAGAGVASRVTAAGGDLADFAAAGSFDAVVMIEVLHEIAPGARQAVIDGCARALENGGWLVIIDETYPETLAEARRPEFLFPIQTGLEELAWGNVIPTRSEQEHLLRAAGFSGAIERALIGEGFTLLTTRKP
jgi:SAM-dependent methyltransferase